MEIRQPVPPFDKNSALEKVQAAENGWNTRDAVAVSMAYTEDSQWRNRGDFINGRQAIQSFLTKKWQTELSYRLRKELWSFADNRIAVTFQYEWHDAAEQWYRSYGNELWEFNAKGLMQRRIASINDQAITFQDRIIVD